MRFIGLALFVFASQALSQYAVHAPDGLVSDYATKSEAVTIAQDLSDLNKKRYCVVYDGGRDCYRVSTLVVPLDPSANESIILAWDAPAERESTAALSGSEIYGYTIEFRKQGGEAKAITVIGNIQEYTLYHLPKAVWEVRAMTIDTTSLENGGPLVSDPTGWLIVDTTQ
jgi:hypothetical protein